MSVKLTRETFLADPHGALYRDVAEDLRLSFDEVLEFFNDPDRQRRMEESELHHDRPALAGVVREFEAEHWDYFAGQDGHLTWRLRQAVGVVVRMVMKDRGWDTTGVKDSLGQRGRVPARSTAESAYRNVSGLCDWFTRAERYVKPGVKEYPRLRRERQATGRAAKGKAR